LGRYACRKAHGKFDGRAVGLMYAREKVEKVVLEISEI